MMTMHYCNRVSGRLMLLVPLVCAACAPESGRDRGQAPDTARAEAAVELGAECDNREDGYSIRYPSGWHVNAGTILPACSLFDPEPIHVPIDSEVPIEFAVILDVEPVAFATVTGDVLGRVVHARETVTIAGRPAVRIDGETTGEGLHSAGIRLREYFVDTGAGTFMAVTYDAGSMPFEAKRGVLDAMVQTLALRPRPATP